MEPTNVKRKLAVILAADAEGYTRLMREAEEPTLETLTEYRDIIDGLIVRHEGRVFGTGGDSVVAEFGSAVEAVRCAIATQEELAARNAELPVERKLRFRIGVHLGDVMVKADDLFGDGVNVAARLEGLAEPGGVCISGDVYNQVKHKLSLSFEDIGPQQVKNVAEMVPAYRIIPGQLLVAGTAKSAPEPSGSSRWAMAAPDKPSIAVLPFANMSGDPEQEYFSDGITEDLITDLSKISGLFVPSRNAVFRYKGEAVEPQRVGRDLDVRYLLEGSVRKSGDRVRITAQLVDTSTGYHLWAERYDRDLTDIFALQDEIAEKIVAALEVKLTEGEQEQVASRYTEHLEAYDYFLRGRAYLARFTKDTNVQAREMFDRAIELDPAFAAAYAMLSHSFARDWVSQWRGNPQVLERIFETAKKAVGLDDSLPLAHTYLGMAYAWKSRYASAIAEAKQAIALDPNFAEGYARLGYILGVADRPDEAVGVIKKAMSLDPHYPFVYLLFLGQSYELLRRYEDAVAALKKCINRNPDVLSAHRLLAVIYSELGQKEEAQAEVAEVLRISPGASIEGQRERTPHKDQAVAERYLRALRKAGLPEESTF